MSKEKGSEPAFPKPFVNDPHWEIAHTPGMSKRFYAACAAMQGLCSTELQGISIHKASERCPRVVALAYQYADELLSKEEEA